MIMQLAALPEVSQCYVQQQRSGDGLRAPEWPPAAARAGARSAPCPEATFFMWLKAHGPGLCLARLLCLCWKTRAHLERFVVVVHLVGNFRLHSIASRALLSPWTCWNFTNCQQASAMASMPPAPQAPPPGVPGNPWSLPPLPSMPAARDFRRQTFVFSIE